MVAPPRQHCVNGLAEFSAVGGQAPASNPTVKSEGGGCRESEATSRPALIASMFNLFSIVFPGMPSQYTTAGGES